MTYMDNLDGMGFDHNWRVDVMRQAIGKYSRIMDLVGSGRTRRNRHADETSDFRR